MKRTLGIACVLLMNVWIAGCDLVGDRINGNGNLQSEQRNVGDARRIRVMGSMDVILIPGATASVKVEADENLIQYIETREDDRWLKIRTRDHVSFSTRNPIRVYVTTPEVTRLVLLGSGKVTTEGEFVSESPVEYDIAGSGDVTMKLNAPSVSADISGSGSLQLSGETRDIKLEIAGSGSFKAEELKAENAKVKIAGSGDAFLYAESNLDVRILGSGSVRYRGKAIVNKNKVGSGTVAKIP